MPDATLKSGPYRKSLEAGCISGAADEQRLAERNPRKQALQSNTEQPGSRSCRKPLYNSRSSTRRFIRDCLVCVFVRVSSAGPPPFSFTPRAILLSVWPIFADETFFPVWDWIGERLKIDEDYFIGNFIYWKGFWFNGSRSCKWGNADIFVRLRWEKGIVFGLNVRMYVCLFVPLT